jgi:D-alanyl-D-alanine carboxypeptidase/D-alanyl-D-alanine-endopeptidase (penicillin-binding protein 4)
VLRLRYIFAVAALTNSAAAAPTPKVPGAKVAARLAPLGPRVGRDATDPHEKRISQLRTEIDNVLADRLAAHTRIGVEVMRASDGDLLYQRNAEKAFNPASNTKMLTTAAAIGLLGAEYRYVTTLVGPEPDEHGVVHGDVVLRGSGDPSLTSTDLGGLARDLAARGITHITGDLIADPANAARNVANGVEGDLAPGGALIFHRNAYRVHVRASDAGHRAYVWVEPRLDLFRISNRSDTVKGKRSRLKIDAHREGEHIVIDVRGKIAESRGEYIDNRRLGDGALAAAHVLKNALADFGVELDGTVHISSPSQPGTSLLAAHLSPSLAEVCAISNKPSNNFVAEAIYRTVGGEIFGGPGTTEKGTRAVADYLTKMGVPKTSFHIINGSGLTHENRITPHALAIFLRNVYLDPSTAPDFMQSLAIAGIDGTIQQRFAGTEAVGLVRAKTGTLSGVSALSGYVGDKDDVLVFSIFIEGFRNKRTNDMRRLQVRMAQAMLRYLRTDGNAPPPVENNGEMPGEDSESDDESLNLQ